MNRTLFVLVVLAAAPACTAVCPPELHAPVSASTAPTRATFADLRHDDVVQRLRDTPLQIEGRMWCGLDTQNLAPGDGTEFRFEESVRVYSTDRAIAATLCRCRGSRLRLTGRFTPPSGAALGSLDVTDLECR